MDWIWTGILLIGLAIIIGCSEIIRKKLNWSIEATRKFIHIITGIFIAVTPFILDNQYPLLTISGFFALFNFIAIKKGWMKSMHATERVTYGTVFYPVSFFLLILFLWPSHKIVVVIAMLIMAIADATAAIVGENIKNPLQYRLDGELKTVQGSIAMFVASFLITFVGLNLFSSIDNLHISMGLAIWTGIIVAILATACEAISYRGSDNLTVPLGASFAIHYIVTHSPDQVLSFSLGILIALILALISYKFNLLNGSGAIGTFLLGCVVFGIGKWEFSIPILLFFLLSSLLSKMGKNWKKRFAETFQKGGRRDIGQVLANGGVAGIFVILWNYFQNDIWYFAFLGAVAAVTADTWGTEIGVFSRRKPRHILNMKLVEPGTSGGVSLIGFLGGLAGSFVIVYLGSLFTNKFDTVALFIPMFSGIIIAGFLGSIIDSILGATVQAQFKCPNCGKITERKIHCKEYNTNLFAGFPHIDNDFVNAMCSISGAVFSILVYLILV